MNLNRLNDFIDTTPELRELKRALAVKLRQEGRAIVQVAETLNVSTGYVSKWAIIYEKEGVLGLKLGYKGSESFLSVEQKDEIIDWLKERAYWDLTELQKHIEQNYGVAYKSRQSYYDLRKEAGISCEKAQTPLSEGFSQQDGYMN